MYLIRPEEFHSFIIMEDHTEFLVLTFSTDFIPPDAAYTLSPANMHLVEMIIEEMESKYAEDAFIQSDKDAPQAFYNELKMECAKEMLADGISISSIAEELRFSSAAHFSAAFKKYAGISPIKYKKHKRT